MRQIVQAAAGEAGFQYLTSLLQDLPGLAGKLPHWLKGGDCFALVPAGTPIARAMKWEEGGLFSPEETGVLFERFYNDVNTPQRTIVLQDAWLRKEDVSVTSERINLDAEGAIYYLKKPNETFLSFCRLSSSFLLIVAWYDSSTNDIDELVSSRPVGAAITVYDQEGLLICLAPSTD